MSYDNSELLKNYLHASQISTKHDWEASFDDTAQSIVLWVNEVLSDKENGGFYASQDVDYSLDDDGDYFTWTLDEVRAVLDPQEAEIIAQYYHVEPQGEMHHNPAKNVLFVDQPLAAIAARLKLEPEQVKRILAVAKAKMLAARSKRPTPFVDTTIYSSWNGMMISALLESSKG